jgi:hypothetical protein
LTNRVLPPSDKYVVLHIDDEEEQLFFAKTFLEESDTSFDIEQTKQMHEEIRTQLHFLIEQQIKKS